MAVLSKRELSLPYNCYEFGHTWTPDCNEAALTLGFSCLVEGMKIYTPLYLLSQLVLQRKYSLKEFWNTLQNISASSCFLGFHGFAFVFMLCLLRKSTGKFYFWSPSLSAFVSGFLAILVERKNRRGPLALYCINVASEILFRMATARGIVTSVKNGEVFLFSASMAFFMYIVRRHGFSRDFVSMGYKYVFGKEEAIQRNKAVAVCKSGSIKKLPSSESISSMNCLGSMTEYDSYPINSDFLQRLWDKMKHKSCPHSLSCMQYSLQGFLRPFVIGSLAYSAMRCLLMGKKILGNPFLLTSLLTEKRALNFGLFLGGFGGTFRTINCLLRWCFNKDQALYALPAAFLGGLFMKFFPSSTIALYLTWKLIEVGYALGIEEGLLPKIRGSMLLLYAIASAVILHAIVWEPHNVKPGYLKFLTRITQNKLEQINRRIIDIFGTHASKMYSNFWPELDPRYTSRAFQERVLVWLIH